MTKNMLVPAPIPAATGKMGINLGQKMVQGEWFVNNGTPYAGIYHDPILELFQVGYGCDFIFSSSWYVVDTNGIHLARFHKRKDAIAYCKKLAAAGWSGNVFGGDHYLLNFELWAMGSV